MASNAPLTPEQDLTHDAAASTPGAIPPSTPEPDAARLGEAGNAYMGREASEAVVENERVLDADRVLANASAENASDENASGEDTDD